MVDNKNMFYQTRLQTSSAFKEVDETLAVPDASHIRHAEHIEYPEHNTERRSLLKKRFNLNRLVKAGISAVQR